MASNNQTSPTADDKMPNNPVPFVHPSGVPVQQRSASDPIALEKRPSLVGQSSNIGAQESLEQDGKDTKKMKRLTAKRASAKKSREKNVEIGKKLESVTAILEAKMSYLATIAAYNNQKLEMLEKESKELEESKELLAEEYAMKLAEYEALEEETELLKLNNFLLKQKLFGIQKP